MWTIVCFESDNSVDVVPDFWYSNGSCSWPKKTLNAKKFIDRRISPNEIEFDNYSARALSKNIASFSEARTKVLRAQETSELSSNDDDKNTRKTRRKILCWSPSSDESSFKKSKLPTPPSLLQYDDDDLESIEVFDLDMNKPAIGIQTQEVFSQHPSSNHSELNADYYDSTKQMNKSAHSTPQVLHTSQVLHESTPQNIDCYLSTIDNTSDIQNELKAFKQIVNRNQVTIKYEIKNIQERLDLIFNMQEKILDKLINNQTIDNTECNYVEFLTPMESDEELEKMEDKIKSDLAYRKTVVTELSRLMGQNLSETVRKIMQKLFSDTLLTFYSYIGFKGKKQFSTLQTCAVIFESIRRMKKFTDITNIEIEKPLKTWMAQASARLKKIDVKKSS